MLIQHYLQVSTLSLYALAAGCAATQMAAVPDMPPTFDNTVGTNAAEWPTQQWYRAFSGEELNRLVDLAARQNWDYAAARARVAQADARARQAGAAILPSLDGVGNGNFLAGHSAQGGGHELDWSAMLSASYEIDFWGKNRAAANSARLLAVASRAERDTVALTTLAGVANSYFQLEALRERLKIAFSNRDAAQKLFALIQARFDAGLASPVELATQKVALSTAQISITDLEQAASEAKAGLALLLGRAPEDFTVTGVPLDELHEPQVSAGLPSELLMRRPDIMMAEANLRSGHADLSVARAALFPSLSLTAGAGLQNPALPATVLTIPGVGPSFALGASLLQPIFDHGKLLAQRDEVQAKESELLAAYRVSIVAALVDVENSLAAIHYLDQARDFQSENVAQSERAFEGARLRYEAGSGDFLTLLEAQRTVYAVRDQFVQYKLARLQALVTLCKALGGGWMESSRLT